MRQPATFRISLPIITRTSFSVFRREMRCQYESENVGNYIYVIRRHESVVAASNNKIVIMVHRRVRRHQLCPIICSHVNWPLWINLWTQFVWKQRCDGQNWDIRFVLMASRSLVIMNSSVDFAIMWCVGAVCLQNVKQNRMRRVFGSDFCSVSRDHYLLLLVLRILMGFYTFVQKKVALQMERKFIKWTDALRAVNNNNGRCNASYG